MGATPFRGENIDLFDRLLNEAAAQRSARHRQATAAPVTPVLKLITVKPTRKQRRTPVPTHRLARAS